MMMTRLSSSSSNADLIQHFRTRSHCLGMGLLTLMTPKVWKATNSHNNVLFQLSQKATMPSYWHSLWALYKQQFVTFHQPLQWYVTEGWYKATCKVSQNREANEAFVETNQNVIHNSICSALPLPKSEATFALMQKMLPSLAPPTPAQHLWKMAPLQWTLITCEEEATQWSHVSTVSSLATMLMNAPEPLTSDQWPWKRNWSSFQSSLHWRMSAKYPDGRWWPRSRENVGFCDMQQVKCVPLLPVHSQFPVLK